MYYLERLGLIPDPLSKHGAKSLFKCNGSGISLYLWLLAGRVGP